MVQTPVAQRTDPPARPRTRRRLKRILIVTHRWTALTLGMLLVLVSTSGALVVYAPEMLRWSNAELFETTSTDRPVDFPSSIAEVRAADPEFSVAYASLKDGVYAVEDADGHSYFLDAGTGRINGHGNLYGGVVGFLINLHDCALSCSGLPGYLPVLEQPSAVAGLGPFRDMTWGMVLLAVAALGLIFLAAGAPFIWWPAIRRLRNAFRVRWRKGRFARDFDLHNAIGIVAVVPLLVWGLTGLFFEMPGFRDVWYAATGGQPPPEDNYTMTPTDNPGARITLEQAIVAAEQRFPGAEVTWVGYPQGENDFYSIDLIDVGPDLWAHNATYHGNRSIGVDAADVDNVRVFRGPSPTLSNTIADEWAAPALHYGVAVNGWWRSVWFVLGLTPLLLMITGLSTWLYRRGTRRRRRSPG